MKSSPPTALRAGHEHLVEFYETEDFLVKTVADFISPALRARDAAAIVETAEHRDAFTAAIRGEGVDLDAAVDDGRFVALDADEPLSGLMVDGTPDPVRFGKAVGPFLDRLAGEGRAVKSYGETVARLWAAGDVSSTIALEELWNELARERDFSLLCATDGRFRRSRRRDVRTQRYELTSEGRRLAVFFTKTYARIVNPAPRRTRPSTPGRDRHPITARQLMARIRTRARGQNPAGRYRGLKR